MATAAELELWKSRFWFMWDRVADTAAKAGLVFLHPPDDSYRPEDLSLCRDIADGASDEEVLYSVDCERHDRGYACDGEPRPSKPKATDD